MKISHDAASYLSLMEKLKRLNLEERRIECACESCFALRSGDPEYRPTGARTLWLEGLRIPDEVWASFQIPIGLAFFFRSSALGRAIALYPSPAGPTESLLTLDFVAHGPTTTEVMLTHERVPDLYVGDFDAGWISTLEHLEKYLEAQRAQHYP